MNIEHAGRSGPPPSSRGGGPPLPGGDGVVTLDSWRKSQVLLLDIVQGVCKEANVAKKRKKEIRHENTLGAKAEQIWSWLTSPSSSSPDGATYSSILP